jgi:hypothetical protein
MLQWFVIGCIMAGGKQPSVIENLPAKSLHLCPTIKSLPMLIGRLFKNDYTSGNIENEIKCLNNNSGIAEDHCLFIFVL